MIYATSIRTRLNILTHYSVDSISGSSRIEPPLRFPLRYVLRLVRVSYAGEEKITNHTDAGRLNNRTCFNNRRRDDLSLATSLDILIRANTLYMG